jgi:glycosyltransferase involved in cell wall biosynthesis
MLYINGKFLFQQKSGVQSFARGILASLVKQNTSFIILIPPLPCSEFKENTQPVGLFSNLMLWEQFSLPNYISKQKHAILLNLCNSAPLLSKNQFITIHDLAFEVRNVNWFSNSFKLWYRFLIPRICKSAKHIFTVSDFSKTELISQYTIPENKITIIPNGVSDLIISNHQFIKDKYILLVGSNNPRKNTQAVINNIELISANGLKLVILSSYASVFTQEKRNTHSAIIYLDFLEDEDYYALIKNSQALIYPSFYEGFGIPILESLCLKTPVICSDLNVFKQSFADLPVYCNTFSKKEFNNALTQISKKEITQLDVENLTNRYNFNTSVSLILKTLENCT